MTQALLDRIASVPLTRFGGHVAAVAASLIEADGPAGRLGEMCEIETDDGHRVAAELVDVRPGRVLLSPLESGGRIALGARVTARSEGDKVPVGDAFRGRLVDALGRALEGSAIRTQDYRPAHGEAPAPLDRCEPDEPLVTGIRAIDALLPIGHGQRIGIFAASGVGKTSLIEQLAAQIEADRIILCLVGERGREVESLWRRLGKGDRGKRFTAVAATSDTSAAMRARAVSQAVALGEHWRDRGLKVVLIVDSVTRLAMALREIGLAAGAPPATRAYTPNVFSAIPRLVERCGALKSGGSLTAVMTVLSETDELDDPIVELMKSLLDGHILLSRTLAEQGHFPAIDIPRSISRGAHRRMTPGHRASVKRATAMLAAFEQSRVMIESGMYRAGTNPLVDQAISGRDRLIAYLQQEENVRAERDKAIAELEQATSGGGNG